ncbi:unnamed protein product, partial [Polarella glacialis]
ELLQLVRFENMTPGELRSVAKSNLPSERYIELLEQVSGAVPQQRRSRPTRERPMRPYRCSSCGVDAFVTTESGTPTDLTVDGPNSSVESANGGPIPECRRYHTGFMWNLMTCEDHNGKCPTCKKCQSRRWSCCQMAESSLGCRKRPHEWCEVDANPGWWEKPSTQKRQRTGK